MKVYKVLTSDFKSSISKWNDRVELHWKINEWRKSNSEHKWLYSYSFFYVSSFLTTNYYNDDILFFEAETDGEVEHSGLFETRSEKLRIIKQIDVPALTIKQQIKMFFLITKEFSNNNEFNNWFYSWENSDLSKPEQWGKGCFNFQNKSDVLWERYRHFYNKVARDVHDRFYYYHSLTDKDVINCGFSKIYSILAWLIAFRTSSNDLNSVTDCSDVKNILAILEMYFKNKKISFKEVNEKIALVSKEVVR